MKLVHTVVWVLARPGDMLRCTLACVFELAILLSPNKSSTYSLSLGMIRRRSVSRNVWMCGSISVILPAVSRGGGGFQGNIFKLCATNDIVYRLESGKSHSAYVLK